jgi:hypothetical protein
MGGTMPNQEAIARAQTIKGKHERELMGKRNVVGVGIGFRQRAGQNIEEVCIVVSVSRKVPLSKLSPRDVVPSVLEGVPVDVQETGPFRPL